MAPEIMLLPRGPLQTNCYILICGETKSAAVIDPSWDGEGIATILAEKEVTLTHILLTHAHFDHVGGLADLKTAVPAPIYLHPDATEMLAHAVSSAARFNIPMAEPPAADQPLAEGDRVHIGALTLHTLFTPGHAPGHVCFHLPAYQVVFAGDALFQGSIGRTDLPGGDHPLLIRMIQEKLLTLPEETQVLSGHGPVTTIGAEKRNNPFLRG